MTASYAIAISPHALESRPFASTGERLEPTDIDPPFRSVGYGSVGKEQHTNVGETASVTVGKLYKLTSEEKFDGQAKVWEIRAEDRLFLSAPGGYIEITKDGIRIRGLKVDIEGNQINFKKGGPGEGATCLRQMAKSSTPFVRG